MDWVEIDAYRCYATDMLAYVCNGSLYVCEL